MDLKDLEKYDCEDGLIFDYADLDADPDKSLNFGQLKEKHGTPWKEFVIKVLQKQREDIKSFVLSNKEISSEYKQVTLTILEMYSKYKQS